MRQSKLLAACALVAVCESVFATTFQQGPAVAMRSASSASPQAFGMALVQPPASFMDLLNQPWTGASAPPALLPVSVMPTHHARLIAVDFSMAEGHSARADSGFPAMPGPVAMEREAGRVSPAQARHAVAGPTLFQLPRLPEPSFWTLLSCGFAVVGFIAWRKSGYIA